MDQFAPENVAELDGDIRAAMDARISFDELFLKWIQPRKGPQRALYGRYIAERVHNILSAWASK